LQVYLADPLGLKCYSWNNCFTKSAPSSCLIYGLHTGCFSCAVVAYFHLHSYPKTIWGKGQRAFQSREGKTRIPKRCHLKYTYADTDAARPPLRNARGPAAQQGGRPRKAAWSQGAGPGPLRIPDPPFPPGRTGREGSRQRPPWRHGRRELNSSTTPDVRP